MTIHPVRMNGNDHCCAAAFEYLARNSERIVDYHLALTYHRRAAGVTHARNRSADRRIIGMISPAISKAAAAGSIDAVGTLSDALERLYDDWRAQKCKKRLVNNRLSVFFLHYTFVFSCSGSVKHTR